MVELLPLVSIVIIEVICDEENIIVFEYGRMRINGFCR
jgi:hypothetical protein